MKIHNLNIYCNMKHLIFTIVALFALTGYSSAQVTSMTLGYCNGEMKTSGTSAFTTPEKDTWLSAAIYIPQSQLSVFHGNCIDEIHAGLASSLNIDSLRVWIRTSLDGEDLAHGALSKTYEPKLAKGWNNVTLETPLQITQETPGIYIGYSFHQKGSSVGISVLPDGQENACFVKLGSNEQWTDRSSEGTLAIEAVVHGDNLPKYNLALKNIKVQPIYIMSQGSLSVEATVRNMATCQITGFDLQCTVEDYPGNTYTAHVDETLAFEEEKTVTVTFYPECISSAAKDCKVNITVANLNEGEDENITDNTLATSIQVVEKAWPRHILVEEFTTEKCPNCPAVAGIIADIIEKEPYNERVNVICHHNGYYTDWLTIPCAASYLWFYNMDGSTFAPALLIDRATKPYTANRQENSPIYSVASQEALEESLDTRLLDVSLVSLDIKAEMDSVNADKVKVTVSGERALEHFTVNEPRINVMLYENNIKPQYQAGANASFKHQHVARDVNSTWGATLTWDGDTYTYSCELDVADNFVRDNLGIIAFIWDYNEQDPSKCEVANSAGIHFSDFTINSSAGISSRDTAVEATPVDYYNASGVKVSSRRRGLNIIRMADGSIRKQIIR